MNHFFGPILIAAKNIGDQICTQVAVLTYNMTKALNPVIVKAEGSGDHQTMINLSYKSCRFSFLLYLLLAVPFIFNAEHLLAIWLKKIPEWAVLFCQLQVLRTLFEQLFTPLRMSLMAQGSVKEMNLADLIFGVATFIILWQLYIHGLSPQWHYYTSIIILVFLSGLFKVYLCVTICNMNVIGFIRSVINPCFYVFVLAIVALKLLHNIFLSQHILISVFCQIFILFILELLVGLTSKERGLLFSKFSLF